MKPLVLVLVATLTGASQRVTIDFDGPLDEALRAVAEEGGVSVIIDGRLERTVQVHLDGVPASDALEALARLYELETERVGDVWHFRARQARAPETAPPPRAPPTAADEATPSDVPAPVEAVPSAARPSDGAEVLPPLNALGRSAVVRGGTVVEGVVAAGGRVHVEPGAVVQHDVVALGGSVRIDEGAYVRGDAVAMGGSIVVEPGAEIDGDAVALGGSITLRDGATLRGEAVSLGGRVLREGKGAVHGRIARLGGPDAGTGAALAAPSSSGGPDEEPASAVVTSRSSRGGLGELVLRFALLFVAGFLGMTLFPARLQRIEETVRAAPLRSGVVGLLTLAAALPATVLLVITLVGIPVALLLWVALPLAALVGVPAVASVVGARLPLARLRRTRALVLACGLTVLLGASAVPRVGPFVTFAMVAVGLGAVVSSRAGRRPLGVPVPDFGARGAEM